jgi:steroid delta-isomerase-like uncharacterized protein
MSDQNLAANRASFAAWNAHDATQWLKSFAEDAVFESETVPTSPLKGHAGLRQVFDLYHSAFPDTKLEILQEIASGPFVVARTKASGTHHGSLGAIPATHRHVSFEICFIAEYRNGKIIHTRNFWDTATMLRQLGVMPQQT